VVAGEGGFSKYRRAFGTTTGQLEQLAGWLAEHAVTHVAMEATGVYWQPVWTVLEGRFGLLLANARHIRNVPGRKTDTTDAEWIADLLQHGLLRASFVPPRDIQDLRDLTRYRASLVADRAAVANRIQKLLEKANLKLAAVATDVLGASGRAMMEAILRGEDDPVQLAERARGRLRAKLAELAPALEGRVRDHHRQVLRLLLDDWDHLERQIERLETLIREKMCPHEPAVELWRTIPGVETVTAWTLVAEMGVDASQFASPERVASWAGLCPGNHESAGKRHSGRMRAGNRWLKSALCQAAWAATRKRDSYYRAQFRRLSRHLGQKKAVMAVAHSILVTAYCMLRDAKPFTDLGGDFFDRRSVEDKAQRLIRSLQQLGYTVTLEQVA
jgi:transposase